MKFLDISDSLKIIQKHKKAEKSKVTDRPTDIVNYRVALTRLKKLTSCPLYGKLPLLFVVEKSMTFNLVGDGFYITVVKKPLGLRRVEIGYT